VLAYALAYSVKLLEEPGINPIVTSEMTNKHLFAGLVVRIKNRYTFPYSSSIGIIWMEYMFKSSLLQCPRVIEFALITRMYFKNVFYITDTYKYPYL
jgi:hypothetical protein